jgi:predicted HTH transcriptional regulator
MSERIPTGEEDVLRLIREGESTSLEFKSSLRWDYRESKVNSKLEEVILKSLAAFNNGEGGILLIGVSDDGEALGLQNDYQTLKEQGKDYFELHLRNLVNSEYGIDYGTRNLMVLFPSLDGKEICFLKIAKGDSPLFTTATDKSGQKIEKFYVRSGNSSREIMKPSEITLYISKRFTLST